MKSREQIAIEALPRHSMKYTDGDATMIQQPYGNWLWRADVLAALPPPAQGSIDADGFLPLPETRYNGCGDGSEPLYTPDMMHAYVLADRAARQSADAVLLEYFLAATAFNNAHGEGSSVEGERAAEARFDRATQAAHKAVNTSTPPRAAPAPSEPVPQGVPEGLVCIQAYSQGDDRESGDWFDISATAEQMYRDEGHKIRRLYDHAATTATSGGEAVAFGYFCVDSLDIPYPGSGFSRTKPKDGLYETVTPLYLAPPPLPATDAASVRKAALEEAATACKQDACLSCWGTIRALISKEEK